MELFFTLLNILLWIGIIMFLINVVKKVKRSMDEIEIVSKKIDIIFI